MLHDNALLSSIHLSILIDTSHEFVIALFGLDFIWEPFLEEGGEFVVEVIYHHKSVKPLNLSHTSCFDVPEFAFSTLGSRQKGHLACLLFCMTIKQRMQNTCSQRSLTGRHLISMHMGHE
jgi:hypothetical protein